MLGDALAGWSHPRVRMAGAEGLEPPTPGFGDPCSSQLSYAPASGISPRVGVARTHVARPRQ